MKKQTLQTTLTVKEIEEMLNIKYWNLRRKEIEKENLSLYFHLISGSLDYSL